MTVTAYEELLSNLLLEERNGGQLAYAYVSPEMATGLLAMSGGNRPISKSTVNKYKSHMMNGTWDEDTPTGFIMFDKAGVLIDGHHRLEAVKRCGKTVKMFFLFNMERSPYIDRGRARSEADALCMAEGGNRGKISSYKRSVAICMVLNEFSARHLENEAKRADMISKHIAEFSWVNSFLKVRQRKLGTAPVTAAMYLAKEAGASDVKLEYFWNVLQTGYAESSLDRQIVRLRDWIKDSTIDGRCKHYRRRVFLTTSYVLARWLDGKETRGVPNPDCLVVWNGQQAN